MVHLHIQYLCIISFEICITTLKASIVGGGYSIKSSASLK